MHTCETTKIGIGIEKTGSEGSARRWKLHSMHRREGVLYGVRPAPVVGETRTVIGRRFHHLFCVLSPFRVLSLSSRAFFLSPLIRRCISSFLSFSFLFFLFSRFLLFVPVRRFSCSFGKVGLQFLKTRLFELENYKILS